MKVRGKVVVVTGAGSGLGREVTLELLRRGARVAAVDLRADGLAETQRAAQAQGLTGAGPRLSTHPLDITDRAAVEALPDAVIAAHGCVDAVVNNAGIMQPFRTVEDLDYPTIERVIDVNLMGTLHMVKAFLPHLKGRPQGHICNVSSLGSFLPVPGQAVYGASKAAVKLLSEALYAELLDTHVGVSVVLPGGMATNISANSGVTMPTAPAASSKVPITPAPEAARILVEGIERDRLHVLIGSQTRMMDAVMRVSPKRAIHLIQKQMKHLLAD